MKGSFLEKAEKNNQNVNTANQNKSILKESLAPNQFSSLRTPTYPTYSEKKQDKKPTYPFLERNLLESFNSEEELYYELSDSDLIDFHENLVNPRSKESAKTQTANMFSNFNDWVKMIQKVSAPPDKLSESMSKTNQDSIQEVFRVVLLLKERNWYEEIVLLYKVKNYKEHINFKNNFKGEKFNKVQPKHVWHEF